MMKIREYMQLFWQILKFHYPYIHLWNFALKNRIFLKNFNNYNTIYKNNSEFHQTFRGNNVNIFSPEKLNENQ